MGQAYVQDTDLQSTVYGPYRPRLTEYSSVKAIYVEKFLITHTHHFALSFPYIDNWCIISEFWVIATPIEPFYTCYPSYIDSRSRNGMLHACLQSEMWQWCMIDLKFIPEAIELLQSASHLRVTCMPGILEELKGQSGASSSTNLPTATALWCEWGNSWDYENSKRDLRKYAEDISII